MTAVMASRAAPDKRIGSIGLDIADLIARILIDHVARRAVRSSVAALVFAHRLAQQPLDLRVDRAQVVGGPLLELLPELGVDALQELLARHHATLASAGVR